MELFDIIFSSNHLLENQDLTNYLIDLRRLLVPNGLLLLLELVHIPLYFDLIFAFKQNEELLCGILSRILQTIQKLSYFYPFVYVLTNNAQFNNDSNLNIIPSPFIGLARSLITEYERNRLKPIDLQTSLNNELIFIHTLIEYMNNSSCSSS
ncbi:unnamed protein product [Adineta steineri]|uniref:Uncharacterized protein n=1 Tax=Adineta steineri TaxID=433720 RepID=A0A815H3F5_9BILA|nr:unnamed protein product [Adineta steineri]CAF1345802.1 unnamed protein product [Adineta steineri]